MRKKISWTSPSSYGWVYDTLTTCVCIHTYSFPDPRMVWCPGGITSGRSSFPVVVEVRCNAEGMVRQRVGLALECDAGATPVSRSHLPRRPSFPHLTRACGIPLRKWKQWDTAVIRYTDHPVPYTPALLLPAGEMKLWRNPHPGKDFLFCFPLREYMWVIHNRFYTFPVRRLSSVRVQAVNKFSHVFKSCFAGSVEQNIQTHWYATRYYRVCFDYVHTMIKMLEQCNPGVMLPRGMWVVSTSVTQA